MDMTDLKFEDSTFDAVIEKGTLDVLFVGGSLFMIIESFIFDHIFTQGSEILGMSERQPQHECGSAWLRYFACSNRRVSSSQCVSFPQKLFVFAFCTPIPFCD